MVNKQTEVISQVIQITKYTNAKQEGSRGEHGNRVNTRNADKHITIPNDEANTNRLNAKGGGVTDANSNRYKYNKTTINRTYRTGQKQIPGVENGNRTDFRIKEYNRNTQNI